MRLGYEFFHRPCLEVARDLVGKILVRKTPEGEVRLRITQTEGYCGEEDTACHAHKGRTKRTEVLYADAGTVYVYLCYGIHNLMNIITGDVDEPQGVLIRCCETAPGPGRLTKNWASPGSITGAISSQTRRSGWRMTASALRSRPLNGWASATPARRIKTGSGGSC